MTLGDLHLIGLTARSLADTAANSQVKASLLKLYNDTLLGGAYVTTISSAGRDLQEIGSACTS